MGREHLQARGTAVPGLPARLGAFSALAGGVAVLVGGLVLVGWTLDIGIFKRILPGLVSMNPATAVSLVLVGLCLWLLRREETARAARGLAAGLALAVCLIGIAKLVGISLGWEGGVDVLLFRQDLEAEAATTGLPNRMAPNTALNCLLIGGALLLIDRPTRGGRWPTQWLALLSAAASALALIGYLFGTEALYGVSAFIPMALHTAFTFIFVSLGVLCARPDRGLAALLVSDSAGGHIARRLLPAAVAIPLVLGWLRLEGQRAGLYSTGLGVTLTSVGSMAVFTALVWSSARSLRDADLERAEAEEGRREAEARFSSSFRDAAIGMALARTDGRLLQANRAFCGIVGYSEAELLEMTLEDVTHPEDLGVDLDDGRRPLADLEELGGPALVDELIGAFMEDATARLKSLREAVGRSEAPEVGRVAHALKGSCGSMGAMEMTRLSNTLERAGVSGDLSPAPGLLDALEDEFGRVRAALEAERTA